MSAALDLGTFRIKTLFGRGDRLVGRKCRTVHVVLPDTVARREALEKMRVPFAVCEDSLVVIGDAAIDVAQMFGAPVLPLLPAGQLPEGDPPVRQILATLIEAALPEPQKPEEYCTLILPGGCAGSRRKPSREQEFFTRLVRLRGYSPLMLSASMAAVLGQLAESGFTGIGISFGATSTQISLAWQGREISSCFVPLGGDWIDEQTAESEGAYTWDSRGVRFVDVHTIRRWKENCDQSIATPATRRDQRLSDLYRELLATIATRAGQEFAEAMQRLDLQKPLAIAAAGGVARIPGFRELLAQAFREESAFPIAVGEMRVATDSDFAVARGGLIYAQLEAEAGAALASA